MNLKVMNLRKVVYTAPHGDYEGTWFRNTVRFETSHGFYEATVDKAVNGLMKCNVHVSDDIIISVGPKSPQTLQESFIEDQSNGSLQE